MQAKSSTVRWLSVEQQCGAAQGGVPELVGSLPGSCGRSCARAWIYGEARGTGTCHGESTPAGTCERVRGSQKTGMTQHPGSRDKVDHLVANGSAAVPVGRRRR